MIDRNWRIRLSLCKNSWIGWESFTSGVGMTALYHMVPGPINALMENIFKREIEDNMLLTQDGMWFTLPVGSDEILVD